MCENCGWSLLGAYLILPWEDGDNSYAYVTCPHCGYKSNNITISVYLPVTAYHDRITDRKRGDGK